MNKSGYEMAFNFRDAGGYKTKDGRTVKKGLLYRSDELSKLTPEDVVKMNKLGLKTIIDYRAADERENNENHPDLTAETIYLTPVADIAAFASKEHGEIDMKNMKFTAAMVEDLMINQNIGFVETEQAREVFKEMIDILSNPEQIPSVQHCRGGKDRTGYGIALILGILGVDDETIMEDYMLTNVYKHEKNETSLAQALEETGDEDFVAAMRNFKEARRSFLETSINLINEKYGSIKEYAQTQLGVTDEQVKKLEELYLEDK